MGYFLYVCIGSLLSSSFQLECWKQDAYYEKEGHGFANFKVLIFPFSKTLNRISYSSLNVIVIVFDGIPFCMFDFS